MPASSCRVAPRCSASLPPAAPAQGRPSITFSARPWRAPPTRGLTRASRLLSPLLVTAAHAAWLAQVNTERFNYIPLGMLHTEGGWPKEIDATEKEQTARFKKKVEKDDEYIRQVRALGEAVEGDIKQNYCA